MNHQLPINEACLRNQEPIAKQLNILFADIKTVLEIGSGTGQHAVYVCKHLPHLIWQPSEMPERVLDVEAWRQAELLNEPPLSQLLPCKTIDVLQKDWQLNAEFDAVFTANTIHFIGEYKVAALLKNASAHLVQEGQLIIYGPFNVNGQYTSEGNRSLDTWLKERDPESGIKDLEAFKQLAKQYGLCFKNSYTMPANNMMLQFVKAA